MRVTKPAWVTHSDSKKKRNPLFGLHVHPDCSRLATGGIDAKIRIWSTLPILSKEAEENEANPKLLCTLSNHNGPVLSVRWAHHGRFLASGSDDGIVLIWDIDPFGAGKVFGSDEVNVEAWKPLRRLVGHQSDVVDIAWNRDDSMIASVGLDSTIFIWDGYTFELIRKIEGHQGFVKGVCWDPVGQYLATQSDDKTVKIWNTEDWSCAETVSKPFKNSPGSTFFRRLSWSPDGEFIAASNAMNGPIFVGAVISRHAWNSDISFVGHENTIQVTAFNPRVCFPAGQKKDASSASSMVALGADDNSISVWRNTRNVPAFVAKDVFDRQILDLCWSDDGLTIYGCSSDGTIIAIQFDETELPDLGSAEDTTRLLEANAWKPKTKIRTTSSQQQSLSVRQPMPVSSNLLSSAPSSQGTINQLQARRGPQQVTRLPNGKRRIQPALLGGSGGISMITTVARPNVQQTVSAITSDTGAVDVFAAAADQPLESQSNVVQSRDDIVQNASTAFEEDMAPRGEKRKKSFGEAETPNRQVRSRTLGGGERSRDTGPVREIRPPMRNVEVNGNAAMGVLKLPLPVIQTKIRIKSEEDDNIVAEADNSEDDQPNRISFLHKGSVQWLDFPAEAAVAMAVNSHALLCALEGGTVVAYSSAGIKLILEHKVDTRVSYVSVSDRYGMVVTSSGKVYGWNFRTRKAIFTPTDMAHLLEPGVEIHLASIRPNGTPLFQLTNGAAYAYNKDTQVFEEVCSLRFARFSSLWTRTRASTTAQRNIVAHLETTLNALRPDIAEAAQSVVAAKPQWFNDATELGHFEMRIQACATLHSPNEYKTFLTAYARKIAEEGYKNKADQLIKDLHGPVTFGAANPSEYMPTVCGLNKKELLKDILHLFGKTHSLADLSALWQDRLRLAASEQ